MPLKVLDPRPALVLIDLQKGVTALALAHPVPGIVARAADLANAFRHHDLPVVLVNVNGRAPGRTEVQPPTFTLPADWSELVPELNIQPGDVRITKQRPGAFLGTSLDADLRRLGVTQVVLAGIATSQGVEATARSAYDLGYNVALVIDAITDRDLDLHQRTVDQVFPRLGERALTAEVLERLGR
jgi:nicotinamidase-related amidase